MKTFKEIKHVLSKKLTKLEHLKKKAMKSLQKAPDGTLILSSSHGTVQYYCKTEETKGKGKYIEKKNKKLIEALAQKEYDLSLLKQIEKQEKQIQKILKHLPNNEIEVVYENLHEQRRCLVNPLFITDKKYVEQWLSVKYRGNIYKEENLKYITERGEKVRSKTEKIIADKLYAMGIPYRYEYPVQLQDGGIVYPDFVLLKVSTREEVYMEHLGMMDDPEYCEGAISKINRYAQNGIILGKNLLVTFDLPKVPLDIEALERTLEVFLTLKSKYYPK